MNEENGLRNINVVVCDRPYRLKVKPEEEAAVRKAAKDISERVRSFQNQFAGKDKQDYLAMCALMLAVDKQNLENPQLTSGGDFIQELEQLNTQY